MGDVTFRAESLPTRRESIPASAIDSSEVDRTPHTIERQVCRLLTTHPGLSVTGLVVHRLPGGVCLTGVVDSIDGETNVCNLVRQVSGVEDVINRLLVRSGSGL